MNYHCRDNQYCSGYLNLVHQSILSNYYQLWVVLGVWDK